jgi:two-component sensor histidine kinase
VLSTEIVPPSFQGALCEQVQQQHEVEQELKVTQQELKVMNREIQHRTGNNLLTLTEAQEFR